MRRARAVGSVWAICCSTLRRRVGAPSRLMYKTGGGPASSSTMGPFFLFLLAHPWRVILGIQGQNAFSERPPGMLSTGPRGRGRRLVCKC